jgi:hypothetical protein
MRIFRRYALEIKKTSFAQAEDVENDWSKPNSHEPDKQRTIYPLQDCAQVFRLVVKAAMLLSVYLGRQCDGLFRHN